MANQKYIIFPYCYLKVRDDHHCMEEQIFANVILYRTSLVVRNSAT